MGGKTWFSFGLGIRLKYLSLSLSLSLRLRLDSVEKLSAFASSVFLFLFFFFFFFFGHAFESLRDKRHCYGYCSCIVHEQQPQCLTFPTLFSTSVGPVYCTWDPQISLFSNYFLLKMDPMVLFTHLKIIFVKVFFSFQFPAVSKRTLNINRELVIN